jgi:hypothetical protein
MLLGATAWAISTQANYALAPWSCAHQTSVVPWVSIVLILLAAAGGYLSWQQVAGGRTPALRLAAVVSTLLSMIFIATMLLHGTAGVIFTGCER